MHDHFLLMKSNPPTKERRSSCLGAKRRTVRKVTTNTTKRSFRRVNPMSLADVGMSEEEEDCSPWRITFVFS